MYIHIGKRTYGKCDVVPELFHVATIFWHFDFFPLVPVQSMLIFEMNGQQNRGVKIPFSVKSIVYAWARVGTFFSSVILGVMAIAAFSDGGWNQGSDTGAMTVAAGASALAYGLLMLYPRRIKPTYQRACRLAVLAGLDERGWAALNVLYGREIDERPEGFGLRQMR